MNQMKKINQTLEKNNIKYEDLGNLVRILNYSIVIASLEIGYQIKIPSSRMNKDGYGSETITLENEDQVIEFLGLREV